MPKVLIREYDNSTTGIPASDNFAVVVPGYFGPDAPTITKSDGTTEYLADTELWNASGVYELRSQSDFVKYIGRHPGKSIVATGPTLELLHNIDIEAGYDEYSARVNTISLVDFEEVLRSNGAENVYVAEELTSADPDYGKNRKLIKTITYKAAVQTGRNDDNGNPIYEEAAGETSKTIKLTKATSTRDLSWTVKDGQLNVSTTKVCIVKAGNEGTDAVPDKHIGNQIAYELLGLGYTVLYKKLDTENANKQLCNPTFWEPLKDKSVFNFRYVMTGGCYEPAAMNQICELATFNNNVKLEDAETYGNLSGRGDCIALCDIDEDITGHSISASNTIQQNIENIGYAAKLITAADQYSAIFGPKVTYVMDDLYVQPFGNNKTFPASFHYLACAARTFERYNEWYAVAGYNRGISNYAVATTSVKLGEIAINTLAPRVINNYTNKSINLILHERGNYYIWGNRTAYALDTKGLVFHHFLNIRQLCCSIKKQLYTACRQFTFDPNSDLLWINFVNSIKPTLEAMRADQGIKGYTITRTANDKKALLTARIRIVPIEAVEDFDISIYLEDSLTGIVVNADETQAE